MVPSATGSIRPTHRHHTPRSKSTPRGQNTHSEPFGLRPSARPLRSVQVLGSRLLPPFPPGSEGARTPAIVTENRREWGWLCSPASAGTGRCVRCFRAASAGASLFSRVAAGVIAVRPPLASAELTTRGAPDTTASVGACPSRVSTRTVDTCREFPPMVPRRSGRGQHMRPSKLDTTSCGLCMPGCGARRGSTEGTGSSIFRFSRPCSSSKHRTSC
jgi:hypothetical protein